MPETMSLISLRNLKYPFKVTHYITVELEIHNGRNVLQLKLPLLNCSYGQLSHMVTSSGYVTTVYTGHS